MELPFNLIDYTELVEQLESSGADPNTPIPFILEGGSVLIVAQCLMLGIVDLIKSLREDEAKGLDMRESLAEVGPQIEQTMAIYREFSESLQRLVKEADA